jgi:hypothetical protein
MPGTLLDAGMVYITLTLSTMAGMMLGLFASALAPNPNSASLLVIVMMIPQIVLGGALIALPGPGQYVSALTTTRWAFEAMMSITGVGSDVAGDTCWALPEDVRNVMSLENKLGQGCTCLGVAIFSDCNFPGVGRFYDSKIDDPKPEEPVGPPDPPADEAPEQPPQPALPPKPVEPENQADQIAMADYFAALREWEAESEQIQNDYEAQLDVYQQQVADYQAEIADYQSRLGDYQNALIKYQQDLGAWQIARASAVKPAESLISQINRDFGWTFVDKTDPALFYPKIIGTWIAQVIYSTVLFLVILVLQKRKDVV